VVEDRGGTSALPYYEALNLQPRARRAGPAADPDTPPATPADAEAAMLPVRSAQAHARHRRAPRHRGAGPAALFLSSATTRRRAPGCAAGGQRCASAAPWAWWSTWTMAGPGALRSLVPGLPLSPASGDDLAQRLGLRHYPVLITATGIEQ
jgi:hypothetical protein